MRRRDDYDTVVRACIYGLYSSLEGFSFSTVRYVGVGSTGMEENFHKSAEWLARRRLYDHRGDTLENTYNVDKVRWMNEVRAAGGEVDVGVIIDLGITIRGLMGRGERSIIRILG